MKTNTPSLSTLNSISFPLNVMQYIISLLLSLKFSTCRSHSLQSDFSSFSGILFSLLVANAPVHFKKIKDGGTSCGVIFCLVFCLSLPAD